MGFFMIRLLRPSQTIAAALLSIMTMSTFSFSARADVFTEADTLFKQREESRDKIAQARAEYVALLPSLSGQQLIRAVSQIGRLAIYEGVMVLGDAAVAEKKQVFRDCWENYAEKIKPAVVGENPAYYYFKGACLAYWGEVAGTLASLPYVPTLLDLINKGLASDTRFEGGGVYRLAAGVYSNKKAQPLGLYKPNEALTMIDNALAAAAYPGDPNSGSVYFDNWRGKGLVLVELGRGADAVSMMTAKIQEINDLEEAEELPAGREAEAHWNRSSMERQIADIQQSH